MTNITDEGSDSGTARGTPVWKLWHDELEALGRFLNIADLHVTQLVPGWEAEGNKWDVLRKERDRILAIKTSLGWLSTDAVARVDRRLSEAVDIIDNEISGKASTAALRLTEAEFLIQRAWRSRYWNNWTVWKPWLPLPRRAAWFYIAIPLICALGGAAYVIFACEFFPTGGDVPLKQAFLGGSIWGLAGAIVAALRSLHHRIQTQEFEIGRLVWYFVSPIIGLTFGAIASLLFLMGLLTAGQLSPVQENANSSPGDSAGSASSTTNGNTAPDGQNSQEVERQEGGKQNGTQQDSGPTVDPTPILVLAVLAGFAQNAFLGTLQQMVNARFRGQEEE